MKTNELNDWLGVITNVGIIAGLALVGYEIHQNSITIDRDYRAWRTAVFQQQQQTWVEWNSTISDSDSARVWFKGTVGDTLEPFEQEQFFRLSSGYFWVYYNMFASRETIEPGSASYAARNLAAELKDRPGLRKEFENWRSLYGERSFSALVDKYLSANPDDV